MFGACRARVAEFESRYRGRLTKNITFTVAAVALRSAVGNVERSKKHYVAAFA